MRRTAALLRRKCVQTRHYSRPFRQLSSVKDAIQADTKVKERLAELEEIILSFNRWRRISRNQTTLLVGTSMVAGGIGFATFGYMYTQRNPEAFAVMVTGTAKNAFQYADNYKTRKTVYFSLPEPDVPLSMLEAQPQPRTRAEPSLGWSRPPL